MTLFYANMEQILIQTTKKYGLEQSPQTSKDGWNFRNSNRLLLVERFQMRLFFSNLLTSPCFLMKLCKID
jgi:hypothetical protein